MPLINTSVPNLIQGVSQQPDAVRFDGQCEEQENALSSVVDGLKKRPNTRHIARLLGSAISSNAKIHFINRTEDERYVAMHDGSLRIFNLDTGVEATITDNTSGSGYLTTTTPKDDLEMMTVADYTFVLNKTKDVGASSTNTADYTDDAIIFIKNIDYEVEYKVTTNAGDARAVTGNNNALTNTDGNFSNLYVTYSGPRALNSQRVIAGEPLTASGVIALTGGLSYKLNQQDGITSSAIGGKSAVVNGHTSISVEDSMSSEALGLVWKTVASITDLPIFAKKDMVVKVAGDPELDQDDYYVKFVTNDGTPSGRGYWEETVSPNVSIGIDNSTAPHQLVNTGTNQFTLQRTVFNERNAGDNNSNPHPSFIGKKINSIFFFKNRLGFVTNDSIVMSEAGHFFNFYRKTVTTLLDDAPIDINVASTKVTDLKTAIGFQGNLVLFSDNQQFVLRGGDILTSKTVSISSATSFEVEDDVKPISLGSYIYFPFTRGAYAGVREFAVDASTDNFDAIEVTEHVPAYIPKNIIDMAGTASEDTIALLSGDETNALYIYKYFWNNKQKVLSSWSKFTFGDDIRGIEFLDSTLYLVTVDSEDNTHLLELPLESGLTETVGNFPILLDKRVRAKITAGSNLVSFRQPNGSYSSGNLYLPYTYYNGTIPSVGASLPEVFVDLDGNSHALKYKNIGAGGQVMLSSGNASSTKEGYVGIPYTMKYKFSTQVFKAQSGNSASPTSASAMQVRNGSLFFDKTHTFDVKVTPDGRSEVTETFSADDRPDSETLGNRKFAEGFFRFPVHSKAKNVDIVIENDSPFDSKFSSAEFESFVHPRSKRYG